MVEQIVDDLLGFPSVLGNLNQRQLKSAVIQFYVELGLLAEMETSYRGRVGHHTENVISL